MCYVPSTRDKVVNKMDMVPVFLEFTIDEKNLYYTKNHYGRVKCFESKVLGAL